MPTLLLNCDKLKVLVAHKRKFAHIIEVEKYKLAVLFVYLLCFTCLIHFVSRFIDETH